MRLAVLGGTVVTSAQALRAEVLVEDGRVVAVVEPASDLAASFVTGCDEVIDATGKLVIPGGIDVHTHLGSIGQGSYVLDSFATGTVAAALGGTTTVVDFASPAEGQGMLAGVESYHEKASGESAVDYGFHVFCVGEIGRAHV